MKKIYGFAVLFTLLVLGSCAKEEGGDGNTGMAVIENPFFVTEEQAIDELYQFLDLVDPQTRGERRTVADVKVWNNMAATRGISLDSDVSLYVVNFENNAGFAILSGDSRLTPVIAVIDEGNFDPDDEEDDEEEDPGFGIFLDLLSGHIKSTIDIDVEGSESTGGYQQSNENPAGNPGPAAPPGAYPVVKAWETVEEVGSIIPSKWNQGSPFNDNCGGKPAGCGAIAVAQVMYHFQKDHQQYKWSVMSKIIDGNEKDGAAKAMVAEFIRELGDKHNLNMDYDSDGSSCKIWKISKTFRHFGYKEGGDWKWGYNADRIAIYLKVGPVIVSGFEKIFLGVPSGGHYWVVDKYVKQKQVTQYYSSTTGKLSGSKSVERELVHCNWGKHDNSKNGYFYNGVFNSNEQPPEQPTRGENDYYQYYMCMVTYISPDDIL